MIWKHKDLLDTKELSKEEILYLLDKAEEFYSFNKGSIKKSDILRGKSIILLFTESSTRTKTSFDIAGKRLSADTFALASSGSSMSKGEDLRDTGLTLQAMNPDAIVIRDSFSGAAQYLAKHLHCPIVNAGDGWHAHPTQALLDAFTLKRAWNGEFEGKTLLIMGDVQHSRVAHSNRHSLKKLGVNLRICGPSTLLPRGIETWGEVYTDLREAAKGVDAIICLRMQFERQQAGLVPSIHDYVSRYCLTEEIMALANPNAALLHPGPINRGIELSSSLADGPQSQILNQVEAGVAIRMAALSTLILREGN